MKQIKKLAESKGFTYIFTHRKNSVIYIDFICNKHKQFGIQSMRKNNMKRNIKGCKYCKGDYPKEYIIEKLTQERPDIQLIGEYKNISTSIKCLCKKHNHVFYKSPNALLAGRGCYYCGIEKLSKYHLLSQSEYINMLFEANPDIELISNYNGMENEVTVKCKKCGYIWNSNARSLILNGTSCKKCSYHYKGEEKLISILDNWKYKYFTQYKFSDCKDIRMLPFDFYLPDFNTCIEFDGQQHYIPKFGIESLSITKKHDEIKNQYCKKNGIKLIRIPYIYYHDLEYYLFNEFVKNGIIIEKKIS